MIQYLPLQPILPTGFHSWAQILTDWGVRRAYLQSKKRPRCYEDRPELAAPFVAEISALIRCEQLERRALRIAILRQSVTEPAYDRAGGPAYVELRDAMEAAQERYFAVRRDRKTVAEATPVDVVPLRAEMERLQANFLACRRRHEQLVDDALTSAVRAFWERNPTPGIPDTFFANVEAHTAAARMQRIHPPWWGTFLLQLQEPFSYGHPAEGRLLDALPHLRAEAKKKTFAGMIADWRAAHADRWGWYRRTHHRQLAIRAAKKADQVVGWFNDVAPGYLAKEAVRQSLHAALAERLAAEDPWSVTAPNNGLGAHWRN